jgi:hypothetical protein
MNYFSDGTFTKVKIHCASVFFLCRRTCCHYLLLQLEKGTEHIVGFDIFKEVGGINRTKLDVEFTFD